MKDLMVDIETLGTDTNSTIIQIAGAYFDIETGEVGRKISLSLDVENTNGLRLNKETMKWWVEQKNFKEIFSGTLSEREMYHKFHEFVSPDTLIWCNGITFDSVMLKHQMGRFSLDFPFKYNAERDLRTIIDITERFCGWGKGSIKEKFTNPNPHNAMSDVLHQIKLLNYCFKSLKYKVQS